MLIAEAELEPELNVWLDKVFPGFDQQIEPATAEELATIERHAGRPLPRFYRWFLARMGRNNTPFRERSVDYDVRRVLRGYESGELQPHPRYLFIGYETNPEAPEHVAYDLDHAVRDDARVVRLAADDDEPEWTLGYETFREMFLHLVFLQHLILPSQQCVELLVECDAQRDVPSLLDPLLARLGFASPCESGKRLRVCERHGEALAASASLDADGPSIMSVSVGAGSVSQARALIGQLAAWPGLEIRDLEWHPELEE